MARNKFARISLLSVMALTLACAGTPAQTQGQMNQEACHKYEEADAEMNKVYQQVLGEYKKDAAFIQKLKAAQRLWIAFRNAHIESLYPKPNKLAAYGSSHAACRCAALTEVTAARIEALKRWITGVEEGDTCSGSIKMKN
jgi:uncharacterized protein YecT (DUF1311 family)